MEDSIKISYAWNPFSVIRQGAWGGWCHMNGCMKGRRSGSEWHTYPFVPGFVPFCWELIRFLRICVCVCVCVCVMQNACVCGHPATGGLPNMNGVYSGTGTQIRFSPPLISDSVNLPDLFDGTGRPSGLHCHAERGLVAHSLFFHSMCCGPTKITSKRGC